MNVNGIAYRTIWLKTGDEKVIQIIDQRHLPHHFIFEELQTTDEMVTAIKDMHLRGAGLIGAAAGFGIYLAALEAPKNDSFDQFILLAAGKLISTRPTAANLAWAVNRQLKGMQIGKTIPEKINIAFAIANEIADEDAEQCRRIGEHGLKLIEEISRAKKGSTVNILTHCNAGWLAFVDYGSATSAIYAAHDKGINIHVWVDETRPRNQGSGLTAWELGQHGVPNTVIADNTGGHLMQHGMVDMVITGADRATAKGDVANKIGTYLKALAAHDNNIPFYTAVPSSSFDWQIEDGLKEIIIEERNGDEVKYIEGLCDGGIKKVLLTPFNSKAVNYGFDVTPARLITGIITERGICKPDKKSILNLFPEKSRG